MFGFIVLFSLTVLRIALPLLALWLLSRAFARLNAAAA